MKIFVLQDLTEEIGNPLIGSSRIHMFWTKDWKWFNRMKFNLERIGIDFKSMCLYWLSYFWVIWHANKGTFYGYNSIRSHWHPSDDIWILPLYYTDHIHCKEGSGCSPWSSCCMSFMSRDMWFSKRHGSSNLDFELRSGFINLFKQWPSSTSLEASFHNSGISVISQSR